MSGAKMHGPEGGGESGGTRAARSLGSYRTKHLSKRARESSQSVLEKKEEGMLRATCVGMRQKTASVQSCNAVAAPLCCQLD